jgi:tRNA A37 methylthiotransferase MiaB
MIHFLVKRLLSIIPVLLGISLLLFFMLRMLPGDPAQVLAGQMASPEDVKIIRIQMGLDQPFYIQYAVFLKRLVHLDLGVSARTQSPVIQEIWARLPNTILLALCAITLACMTDELLDAVQSLPKVCPHIEVPIQAGDDEILQAMRRGYTAASYRELIAKIRERIPGVSIATDIIVGFPGETDAQFQNTYQLLEDLRMDVAHLARYSPRTGTFSARKMEDDVPDHVKMDRFRRLETLQEEIASEINARLLGKTVSVLFEEKKRGRWRGRTPTNKLVFVDSQEDLLGEERTVRIEWTGPWSMIGTLDS